MRQRVSIARAFANHPKLLLLDEPFGALDALTRGTIQDELLKIWGGTEQTVFMITHDIDEAILLADRILLMTNGPFARVAESVEITIPRPRKPHRDRRASQLLRDPQPPGALPRRSRSKELAGKAAGRCHRSPKRCGSTRRPSATDDPDPKRPRVCAP